MRQMNISIGVLKQGTVYLLQRRGNDPKIGAAGKIGAFGGKIEAGETPAKAVCRELSEETSFRPALDAPVHVADFTIVSDHQLEDVSVHVDAFEITIGDDDTMTAMEGEVVKIAEQDIASSLDLMTPATRYYFEKVKGI